MYDNYNAGIFVRERRRCCFKLDKFITKESQQITKIITTQSTHANIIN